MLNGLNSLNGKKVRITLELSVWGNSEVTGKIVDVSEDWVKVQCKKNIELIATSAIKKVSYNL